MLLTVGVAAPYILSSTSIVNWSIAKFAGLAPLKLEVGSVQAGWFKAVAASDIKLIDESGNAIAKVASVSTEKGLLGWITNQSDLGTVRIDGTEAAVVAANGTTNIEQVLASLLNKEQPTNPEETKQSGKVRSGKIEITNTKLLLSEQGRPEQWVIDVPTLKTELPKADQLFGPIDLSVRIAEVSGVNQGGPGEILATAEQTADGAIQLKAKLTQLPLDIIHVVCARLPDLPIEAATGRISGSLAGIVANADKFTFDLQQVQVQNLGIQAPSLVGPTPARLNTILAAGRLTLADKLMKVEDTELSCDFGKIQAVANIPWPIQTPSLASPFIAGANIQAVGLVDLPKLTQAAQSLVPMRPDTQLRAGQLQFSLTQQSAANGQSPSASVTSTAKVVLTGLEAQAAGQQIRWNEPVTLELSAEQLANGPQFGIGAIAEFCNLKGRGTIENGIVEGNIDLALMHLRLSQFVTLPVNSMTGQAQMNMGWKMDANQLVTLKGQLATTPVVIETSTRAQMTEPAWTGNFDALMQLRNGTPTSINKLRLEMLAKDEKINVNLHDPIDLATTAPAASTTSLAENLKNAANTQTAPAAFDVAVTGKLANWKHRALVWMSQPPEMDLDGVITAFNVSGKLDTKHAEVLQANWDIESLKVRMSDMGFAEPKVVGNFNGKVDTSDLTKLQIDQLKVQASSFSLVAKDEAAANNSRRGQANFVVDLQRLLTNVNGSAVAGAPNAPTTQYSATGQMQGGLAWSVNSTGAEFRMQAQGKDIVATSVTAGSAPSPLWAESQVIANADGRWVASTGAVSIEPMQLQTPWINYQGKLAYGTSGKMQNLTLDGQAVYDAGQLSQKIAPMTGNNLQLAGQQTMPINVKWQRDTTDTTTSALAGLEASARFGWDQARVVGIEVGKADVPVNVTAGKLTTAAEIPVSGGVLRWDIFSDLTAPNLVIQQKPMTVLENVAITREMCSGWLKYVAPLLAEATSIDGRLSLALQRAEFTPSDLTKQTVEGQLLMHKAEVGPGPLSNELIGVVKQIDQIRKADFTQPVSAPNRVWLQLPQQQIAFAMVQGRVYHKDLKVDLGDASLSTSGSVDVAGQLELMASMPIPDKWTEKGVVLTALRGQSLQFPVRGTVSKPQLDASALRQIGRQTLESAGQNLLQQQLNKGLDKLFK
jgi:translocation and assembly module TamB